MAFSRLSLVSLPTKFPVLCASCSISTLCTTLAFFASQLVPAPLLRLDPFSFSLGN
ncbi:hypothetical protein I79_000629 [Cricetulus griseus]|uniref:Uncharacterized protein n=1 Tax=Cricetulus griseus TaxID=10029 RepID=G3GSL2_CRIGR|nr:hypothetical protein I79_000629 [Cricetulus griseus]